jgi:hypothetical protein
LEANTIRSGQGAEVVLFCASTSRLFAARPYDHGALLLPKEAVAFDVD